MAHMSKADPQVAAALAAEAADIAAWFARLPWRRGHSPLRWLPEFEDYLFDQWEHGAYDAFWRKLGICAHAFMDGFADIPMTHMSSWFDPYPRTATCNYLDLKARGKGPLALILGPWTHGDRCLTWAGDVDFGPASTLEGNLATSFPELRLRFFDRWLKGKVEGDAGSGSAAGPDAASPAVRYFRMGGGSGRRNPAGRMDHGGRWLSADDWPPSGTRQAAYHLRADGALDPDHPETKPTAISYRYDPAHPVPSIGGTITSGEPIMRGGAFDQVEDARFFGCAPPFLPLASRPDLLVFQTPPLQEDVEVTGPVAAELWISSDRPDTDFTIKLVDVYPPNADYPRGFAMNVTDGILRVRYRDSWESPRLMTPGQVYRIRVDAFPTSNLFARGHRIRLDISSSNFPHFDANPNSGESEGRARLKLVATNTLHLGPGRESKLILPVRG
jgi:putative CocE/NonD family hydrolase